MPRRSFPVGAKLLFELSVTRSLSSDDLLKIPKYRCSQPRRAWVWTTENTNLMYSTLFRRIIPLFAFTTPLSGRLTEPDPGGAEPSRVSPEGEESFPPFHRSLKEVSPSAEVRPAIASRSCVFVGVMGMVIRPSRRSQHRVLSEDAARTYHSYHRSEPFRRRQQAS